MGVVRRPDAPIRATRPHRGPRPRFPQVHSVEPGPVIPPTWQQPPDLMDADDDHLTETADREPNEVVGLDDNPELAFAGNRRYSSDVHLPVTRIRRPVRLDGNAPRRIPPNGRRSHGRDPGPIPPARGSSVVRSSHHPARASGDRSRGAK